MRLLPVFWILFVQDIDCCTKQFTRNGKARMGKRKPILTLNTNVAVFHTPKRDKYNFLSFLMGLTGGGRRSARLMDGEFSPSRKASLAPIPVG